MKPKKKNKKTQSIIKAEINSKIGIAILIVAALVALRVFYLVAKETKKQNNQTQFSNQKQEKQVNQKIEEDEIEEIDTSDWRVCLNEVSNYEFEYPSDWLIVDNYLNVLDNCYNQEKPRLSNFFVGFDLYQPGDRFNIHVETQESLKGTVSENIISLDEYYSVHQESLSVHKIAEVTVDGERADLLLNEKDGHLNAWFFHKKTFYMISSTINDVDLLKAILKTFKFPNE